jgi:23S rRNA (pseudouridine1915-N3)-methyltransferase
MKLILVSVGHKMPDWITAGYNEYAKRMPREAKITLLEIKPEPRTSGKTKMQIMELEAQRISAAVPQHCVRIVLDEHGVQPTTKQFSAQLQNWMHEGRDVAFIIGGADGLHASVKQSAHHLLALSVLTLPHAVVRVILAEQLYRVYSMIHNHPYHRE